LPDGIARHTLGMIVNVLDAIVDGIEPVFVEQPNDTLLPRTETRDLRMDIAPNRFRRAGVRFDDRREGFIELAAAIEFDRRDAQSFLESIGRISGVGILGADVDQVCLAGRKPEQRPS